MMLCIGKNIWFLSIALDLSGTLTFTCSNVKDKDWKHCLLPVREKCVYLCCCVPPFVRQKTQSVQQVKQNPLLAKLAVRTGWIEDTIHLSVKLFFYWFHNRCFLTIISVWPVKNIGKYYGVVKVPVVSIMCASWKIGIILLLYVIWIFFLPLACFPFDKVHTPLFLVPHLLSLPSFHLPFWHYVIYIFHTFIYSSVFAIHFCSHEHHQYLCYPPDFRVLGFGFFCRFLKIFYYYYFCFDMVAGSGLRSLGMAIVQRTCTGTNDNNGKMWWDEKLLYIKKFKNHLYAE